MACCHQGPSPPSPKPRTSVMATTEIAAPSPPQAMNQSPAIRNASTTRLAPRGSKSGSVLKQMPPGNKQAALLFGDSWSEEACASIPFTGCSWPILPLRDRLVPTRSGRLLVESQLSKGTLDSRTLTSKRALKLRTISATFWKLMPWSSLVMDRAGRLLIRNSV